MCWCNTVTDRLYFCTCQKYKKCKLDVVKESVFFNDCTYRRRFALIQSSLSRCTIHCGKTLLYLELCLQLKFSIRELFHKFSPLDHSYHSKSNPTKDSIPSHSSKYPTKEWQPSCEVNQWRGTSCIQTKPKEYPSCGFVFNHYFQWRWWWTW